MAFLINNSKKLQSFLQKHLTRTRRINNYGVLSNTWGKELFYVRRNSNIASQSQPQPSVSPGNESEIRNRLNLSVGDKLSGFEVKQVEEIPELSLTAVKLVHDATKAEYFHIDREDSNNAFSVLFRTTPTDSTGLPHILEHTTLCGSRKYPCRDPFFKMLNRSLATFMNAMTAPDWTMYPFLTQNKKDYRNLMSVYLDAVFRPLLKETDFNQEGWRLEYTNPEDMKSPIIIKGVVFNEMKGVFSNSQTIFQEALMNNILPSHTYSVCSGGDPVHIPKLVYNDLVNFHKNYYAPHNAKYYSYGNLPLSDHLEYINNEYLKNTDITKKGASTGVPPEKRWSAPVEKHVTCKPDPMIPDKNKQSSIAISQLCCSITDIEECFTLKILAELLLSGPNSSFYKTLIEPNIGSGFSPVTGFESDTRDTYFTVALQGVSPDDFQRIVKIYDETIADVVENGLDMKHLEAILHSIELNLKHQTSNFGLSLLFNVVSTWNHDGDIIELLKIEDKVKSLKEKLAKDPKYLQKKVKQYFQDNPHRLVLTMSPDENYEAERKKMEDDVLQEKLQALDEAKRKKIYEDGLKLLAEQQTDDKSCLPKLSIKDLKKDIPSEQYVQRTVSGIPFFVIPQPTNGVTYFRGILNTTNFTEEELSLLPLFAMISTKMGTTKHSYKDFDQLMTLKTGGLSIGTHYIWDAKALDRTEASLTVSSYCLNKNLGDMFDLWLELFLDMELSDLNRFETLVKGEAADLVTGMARMGHTYSMLSAQSLITPAGKIQEERHGMTYVNLMKKIVQTPPAEVLEKMKRIREAMMTKTEMRFAANVLEGTEDEVLDKAGRFVKNIWGAPGKAENFQELEPLKSSHDAIYHVLPFEVNFASKAIKAVPYEHEDYPALRVLSRLLTMKFLHPEIREKAGAYGSGLSLNHSGSLTFYSYFDPNPSNTLQVFDRSASWLLEKNFTQEDVDEAKLGVFQSVDAPVPPGDKGMKQFLMGISDDALRKHRLGLMKVTADELIEVGVKYLDETKSNVPVGRAVIGPEKKAVLENNSLKWNVIKPD